MEQRDQDIRLSGAAFQELCQKIMPLNRYMDAERSMATDGKFRIVLYTKDGHKIWFVDDNGYLAGLAAKFRQAA